MDEAETADEIRLASDFHAAGFGNGLVRVAVKSPSREHLVHVITVTWQDAYALIGEIQNAIDAAQPEKSNERA